MDVVGGPVGREVRVGCSNASCSYEERQYWFPPVQHEGEPIRKSAVAEHGRNPPRKYHSGNTYIGIHAARTRIASFQKKSDRVYVPLCVDPLDQRPHLVVRQKLHIFKPPNLQIMHTRH